MSANFIASVTGADTAALQSGSVQVGDFLIAFASRDGSSTAPSVPVGWTPIVSGGANSLGYALAYKYATSTSETIGTFANASSLIVSQYRPLAGYAITVGATSTALNSSALSASYPAVTLQNGDGTSWVLAFLAHRSPDVSPLSTPPSGLTVRAIAQDSTDSAASFDSAGGLASWSSTSLTYTGTADAYRTVIVEMRISAVQADSFYFRTNDAGSGSWYFRTNVASGLQTITASAGFVADHTSIFFNLDFVPEVGDQVTIPTTVAGSQIIVSSNGQWSAIPALPNGTGISRTARDVSAAQNYSDTITVYNTGTGNDVQVSGVADIATLGTASQIAASDVAITSSAAVTVTGVQGATGGGDVVVTAVASITTTATQSDVLSGDAAITASGSVVVSGSVLSGFSDDVAISSSGTVATSGSQADTFSGSVVIDVAGDVATTSIIGESFAGNASLSGSVTITVTGTQADVLESGVSITASAAITVTGTQTTGTLTRLSRRVFIFD